MNQTEDGQQLYPVYFHDEDKQQLYRIGFGINLQSAAELAFCQIGHDREIMIGNYQGGFLVTENRK